MKLFLKKGEYGTRKKRAAKKEKRNPAF